MPLPISGGGYQVGDGNLAEIDFFSQPSPMTATATATITAAQITGGILVGDPTASAATYTLPTGALLDAALQSVEKNDVAFDLRIINLGTSSGVITLAASTGITIVGVATIAITSSAAVRFRRTGVATWVAYRI